MPCGLDQPSAGEGPQRVGQLVGRPVDERAEGGIVERPSDHGESSDDADLGGAQIDQPVGQQGGQRRRQPDVEIGPGKMLDEQRVAVAALEDPSDLRRAAQCQGSDEFAGLAAIERFEVQPGGPPGVLQVAQP